MNFELKRKHAHLYWILRQNRAFYSKKAFFLKQDDALIFQLMSKNILDKQTAVYYQLLKKKFDVIGCIGLYSI